MFLGKTFFEEKGFPEPFPKTFSDWKKGQSLCRFFLDLNNFYGGKVSL